MSTLVLCVCMYVRRIRAGVHVRHIHKADRRQARICRCGTIAHCRQRPVKESILQRFARHTCGARTRGFVHRAPLHPPVQCCFVVLLRMNGLGLTPVHPPGPHGIIIATLAYKHLHASTCFNIELGGRGGCTTSYVPCLCALCVAHGVAICLPPTVWKTFRLLDLCTLVV